jgi:hypothetical protein
MVRRAGGSPHARERDGLEATGQPKAHRPLARRSMAGAWRLSTGQILVEHWRWIGRAQHNLEHNL